MHQTVTDKLSIQIYLNIIQNIITFWDGILSNGIPYKINK